jgi:hypothetical protein
MSQATVSSTACCAHRSAQQALDEVTPRGLEQHGGAPGSEMTTLAIGVPCAREVVAGVAPFRERRNGRR